MKEKCREATSACVTKGENVVDDDVKVTSNEVAVDADLVARGLVAVQGSSEHQVSHPFDALVARLDAEVMSLLSKGLLGLVSFGDEGEGEGVVGGRALAGAKDASLEGGRELGGRCHG